MQTSDKVSRAVFNFCEMCKDNIKLRFADEIAKKNINLSQKDCDLVVAISASAIDQTFHRAITSITKIIPKDPEPSEDPVEKSSFFMKKPTSKKVEPKVKKNP